MKPKTETVFRDSNNVPHGTYEKAVRANIVIALDRVMKGMKTVKEIKERIMDETDSFKFDLLEVLGELAILSKEENSEEDKEEDYMANELLTAGVEQAVEESAHIDNFFSQILIEGYPKPEKPEGDD